MLRNFWIDLFIRAGGTSSPQMGGDNATDIILRDM